MTMQVLLIESSDLHPSQSILTTLKEQGLQVDLAHTLENAAEKVETFWPNLIIFRLMNSHLTLPDFQNVFDTLKLNIPYIVIDLEPHHPPTSNPDVTLISLNYIQTLPNEIEAMTADQKHRFIRLSGLVIDCQQRQVLRNKKRYALTPKEFKLLYLLLNNHEQVLSRKKIMQTVWETDYMGDTRTLDVHIRWIRQKIEENPSRPKRLITVRKIGYRFIMEPK